MEAERKNGFDMVSDVIFFDVCVCIAAPIVSADTITVVVDIEHYGAGATAAGIGGVAIGTSGSHHEV